MSATEKRISPEVADVVAGSDTECETGRSEADALSIRRSGIGAESGVSARLRRWASAMLREQEQAPELSSAARRCC
jgi:hypothetical protein